MRVMDAKLSLFITQTGADPALARDLLEGNDWHVENAVKVYKLMQNSALPPAGMPKNREPKRNNLVVTAVTGGGVPGAGPTALPPPPAALSLSSSVAATTSTTAASTTTPSGGPTSGGGSGGGGKAGAVVTGTVGTSTLPTQQTLVGTSPGVTRKLQRGLSKTTENINLVNQARQMVLSDIEERAGSGVGGGGGGTSEMGPHFVETPDLTFVLPDLTVYSEDFRAFLHKDLIETSTLVSLEQAGRLNWWADMGACQRLLPLATTGDGNCLLHAASLGMWGFHDRLLKLRKALYTTLTSSTSRGALWRRWRFHQTQVNKQSGLVYSEEEWQAEWSNLLKLASAKPRTTPGSSTSCCSGPATKGLMERTVERETSSTPPSSSPASSSSSSSSTSSSPPSSTPTTDVFYESLEEFHVFVLAHVLRRPIVVVADTILKDSNGEALAPIPFGGIYLPLECAPELCHRTPLLLTYDASHFSALVAMETERSPEDKPVMPAAIPLVDPEFCLLPIHYMVDPGESYSWTSPDKDTITSGKLLPTSDNAMNDDVDGDNRGLALIRRYLNIETIPIPPGGVAAAAQAHAQYSNNLTADLDLGSQPRSRSNSHSGSVDSDENNSVGSSGSSKDPRDKERGSRVAKQMQTVAKSFGSIGKTMSKKLKKNFGGKGILKDERQKEKEREKERKRARRTSVGSMTQSTKVTSVTAELLRDREHLIGVRLSHRRMEYQEEMVRNYLLDAQERFRQNRELRRRQDVEMRRKVEMRGSRDLLLDTAAGEDGVGRPSEHSSSSPEDGVVMNTTGITVPTSIDPGKDEVDGGHSTTEVLSPRMQCINTGCDAKGSASTSYLCPSCYQKEKQQALDFERGPVAADGRPILGATLERRDTLLTCGRSKFYTPASAALNDDDQHYGSVSHVNLAAKQLQHPPLPPSKQRTSGLESTHDVRDELNNARLLRDKKNSYINAAATAGMRVARSVFYEDVPNEFKVMSSGAPSSALSTAAYRSSLPVGTACIVNNLHQGPSANGPPAGASTTVSSAASERLFNQPATTTMSTTAGSRASVTSREAALLEPQLRPEFRHLNGPAKPAIPAVKSPNMTSSTLVTTTGPPAVSTPSVQVSSKLPAGGVSVNVGAPSGGMRQKCRTSNCQFYGTEASDYLCSACYRSKQKQQAVHQLPTAAPTANATTAAARTQTMR